jgi:hypothetical protein
MSTFFQRQFTAAQRVHVRRFGTEIVVLDLASGSYYGLNELGAQVWDALVAGLTPPEIVARLADEYQNVDRNCVSTDVEELTKALLERGLIVEKTA